MSEIGDVVQSEPCFTIENTLSTSGVDRIYFMGGIAIPSWAKSQPEIAKRQVNSLQHSLG